MKKYGFAVEDQKDLLVEGIGDSTSVVPTPLREIMRQNSEALEEMVATRRVLD